MSKIQCLQKLFLLLSASSGKTIHLYVFASEAFSYTYKSISLPTRKCFQLAPFISLYLQKILLNVTVHRKYILKHKLVSPIFLTSSFEIFTNFVWMIRFYFAFYSVTLKRIIFVKLASGRAYFTCP